MCLMLVNPKENVALPILGVSYIVTSLFDKLVLRLCSPQFRDAKWLFYLWGSPWVFKSICHLHRAGQVELLNGTLEIFLNTFLYCIFAYDDTYISILFYLL